MKSSIKVKVTARPVGRGSVRVNTRINHNGHVRSTSKVIRVK